ncbi:hypothetical protein GCM10018952_04470 [Streptosporangium vulgare]
MPVIQVDGRGAPLLPGRPSPIHLRDGRVDKILIELHVGIVAHHRPSARTAIGPTEWVTTSCVSRDQGAILGRRRDVLPPRCAPAAMCSRSHARSVGSAARERLTPAPVPSG